jgi:exoribonuclease-2
VVAWWKGNEIALGVVAGEEKQRVRLVLTRGREARVPATRLVCEVEAPGSIPGTDLLERREAGERTDAADRRMRDLAAGVEVPLVWEIVTDEPARGTVSAQELATLALESSSGEAQAALIAALLDDGLHFSRRGDGWAPRPASAVVELCAERRRVEGRAREQETFLDALRAAVATPDGFVPSGSETERRYLHALERLAIDPDETQEGVRDSAIQALTASGLRFDRPHEGAFRLLRSLGRFRSDDENLQVPRYGLNTVFPQEALDQARRVEGCGFDRDGRRDLTALSAVTIDGPRTREIDDALSVEERPGGGHRLGVHIADPSAFVEPGDAIDREAKARSLSHYMPDLRLPMIPADVSERAASLVVEGDRPALSFVVDIDEQGEIQSRELFRSVIRCRARLDYASADRVLGDGTEPWANSLGMLNLVGQRREEARVRAGAVVLRGPEVEIHVDADGTPRLERAEPDSASRRAVSEAMVLAGAVAAEFVHESGIPAFYRRQGAPRASIDRDALNGPDPVALRQARFSLVRAEVGLEPARHHSLGLDLYTQVTSPIRRYQDLVTQRQIVSALEGVAPAYDVGEMQRILATTEQAAADARRAERAADAYWMLRYLELQTGEELDAVIVQLLPRPVVQLTESLWEQPMPSQSGRVDLGQSVRVRIERVNPRAGLMLLRRTD